MFKYSSGAATVYTDIAKTALGSTEMYNLYGIIVDATTPHPKPNETLPARAFKTHVKIIDPSMHFRYPRDNSDTTNGCISITLFSRTPEGLPTFCRIGDIIRIHRCNVGTFKDRKTFTSIISYGSSWALFEGAGSFNPDADVEMSDDDELSIPINANTHQKIGQ